MESSWLDRSETLLSRLPIRKINSNAMVPFRWNFNQAKRFRLIKEQWEKTGKIRVLDLKSRRVGVSAQTDGLFWCAGMAFPNMNIKIVAHLQGSSEELFRVPSDLSRAFPSFASEDIQMKRIFFPHEEGQSTITLATAGTPAAGRGGTLTMCHLSEAAYYPSDDSFTSMISSVSKGPGSAIVIESTANGREGPGEAFYEYWTNAVAGRNGYIPVFLCWLEDPSCVRPEEEAEDAPADDLEKELMNPPFNATREQIAWMRQTKAEDCRDVEAKWLQDFPHCLPGNTRVSSIKGMIPLAEVEEGDSLSGKKVLSVFKSSQQTVKIIFDSGREVEATKDHLFLHPSGGLFSCGGLKKGDTLALYPPHFSVAYHEVCWTQFGGVHCSLKIDEDWGRFLGYFMGDGSYHGSQVSVCCTRKDQDVVADVERLFEKFLGGFQTRNPSEGATEVRVSRPAFLELMENLGIRSNQLDRREGRLAQRKVCVPECIWRSPRVVVREFLRALLEADGWNGCEGHSIKFFSKHKKFIQDVQLLLLGFGITSRIRKITKFKDRKEYEGYWLWLRSNESRRYHELIGFVGKRKSVYSPYKQLRNPMPIEFTDKIISVEEGEGQVVYDVLLDGDHIFSANGISSHNCPEVAFQVSGSPAFAREEIAYGYGTIKKPLCRGEFVRASNGGFRFKQDENGRVLVWKFPFDKNGKSDGLKYYIGADSAAGVEDRDFAAGVALCGQTGELAARIAECMDPEEFADQLDMMGRWYNMALINPELTGGLGRWTLVKLRDVFRYPQIAKWKGRFDRKRGKDVSNALGFEMNNSTRRLIIDAARSGMRMGMKGEPGGLVISDEALQTQISLCTIKEWRWEVARGHDDILVAWAIAVLTREEFPPARMSFAPKNTMDAQTPKDKLAEAGVVVPESEMESIFMREMRQQMRLAGLRQNMRGNGAKRRDRLVGI